MFIGSIRMGVKRTDVGRVHMLMLDQDKPTKPINKDRYGLKQSFVQMFKCGFSPCEGDFAFSGGAAKKDADANHVG